MKANRCFRRDQEAVSNVLGGILFFSLVFLLLALIRLDFVPVWEEDKEAVQAERAVGQFVQIKSEVDRQAANRTAVQVAHPLNLGSTGASRFFTPATLPATLAFTPGTSEAAWSASELLMLSQGGRSTAAIDEDWITITGPVTLTSVSEIQHLRIRVVTPWDETHGDSVTLTVTDADGDFAGSLTVYLHRDPPEHFLNARVTGPSGTIIYDQGEAFHQISTVGYWWVDALEDEMHFVDVLNAAQAPFSLSLSEAGMDGEYTLSYLEDTGTGSTLVGTSGVTIANYNRTLAGGTLSFDASTAFFPDQDLHFENGAVIIQQEGQAAMRVEPDLTIRSGGTLTQVALTVPALVGNADSVSQKGTVSIATDTASSTSLVGTAPDFNYTVQTAFPGVWSAFFLRAAQDAGLSLAADEYSVFSGPDYATLIVKGASSGTDHDLSIDLSYASIRVTLDT